jgi:hypothetical protein
MYAFIQKSGHIVWKEQRYTLMSRISLWTDLYTTWEDQAFVVDVVVIDPTWETMASNVISWLVGVVAKLSAIVNIHMYKSLYEGHHFISMAMEVHDAPRCDMDYFIKECTHFFHNRWSGGHLSLFFAFNFSSNILILLFNML